MKSCPSFLLQFRVLTYLDQCADKISAETSSTPKKETHSTIICFKHRFPHTNENVKSNEV